MRLCDLNPRARVLQMKDFNPVEFISEGALHRLPPDVGFYTPHPDVSLFCYPNDSPEVTLGLPPTTLEFNCRIEGTEYTFPFDLPPLPRGSLLDVDLIIDDPFNRRAYPWGREDESLRGFVATLGNLRSRSAALRLGGLRVPRAGGGRIRIDREHDDEMIALCCNQSDAPWSLPTGKLLAGGLLESVGSQVTLSPGGFAILRLSE